jgi:hypothetical protein
LHGVISQIESPACKLSCAQALSVFGAKELIRIIAQNEVTGKDGLGLSELYIRKVPTPLLREGNGVEYRLTRHP